MCLAVAVAATVVSGAMSAYGAYAQGQAAKRQNDYAAAVAEQQAKLTQQTAEQNVNLTQQQGKIETLQHQRRVAEVEGQQRAVLAAQGVGGGSVTAADIAESTFDTAKLDEMAIRFNADSRSWGIKNNEMYQTWDLNNQANQYRMAGKNAAKAGSINAGSSLLNTAASVGNSYMMNKYFTGGSEDWLGRKTTANIAGRGVVPVRPYF